MIEITQLWINPDWPSYVLFRIAPKHYEAVVRKAFIGGWGAPGDDNYTYSVHTRNVHKVIRIVLRRLPCQ